VAEPVHACMMMALAHRGPHGAHVLQSPSTRLGHAHFWTTPEEVGEHQPLRRDVAGFDLAFDGRLDNREELLHLLADELAGVGYRSSDAGIVATAYQRWGERCFERLLGPFAVVIVDWRQRFVVLARDPVGDRTLVYHLDRDHLVVASEEIAVLAHPATSRRLDETTLVAFLAVQGPQPGATFFADVLELPPGHVLTVDGDSSRLRRFWELPSDTVRYRRDADYVEHFANLLRSSVSCRLRSVSRCAVLMSGGLDSTSVAATAASKRDDLGWTQPPLAVSWVFDELPLADEREYITAVTDHLGIDAQQIRGDDAWPLRAGEQWSANPNCPLEVPLRTLHRRAYRAARDAGALTMLSGEFGDQLFAMGDYWLADLVRDRRYGAAVAGLLRQGWIHGVQRRPVSVSARRALARTLGWTRKTPAETQRQVPWLTDAAARVLPPRPVSGSPAATRLEARKRTVGDPWGLLGVKSEQYHASHAGIDLRRPFRDRRLIEFAAGVPGYVLHRPGSTKWVLREAMCGVLPEVVRCRRRQSSLMPVVARGLVEREWPHVQAIMQAKDTTWQAYVRPEWLSQVIPSRVAALRDGVEVVVPWQCLSLELWLHGFVRERESP
jgi:asparagine synthase (glutamine-hydrolysing)